jgi:hypothetical protein
LSIPANTHHSEILSTTQPSSRMAVMAPRLQLAFIEDYEWIFDNFRFVLDKKIQENSSLITQLVWIVLNSLP